MKSRLLAATAVVSLAVGVCAVGAAAMIPAHIAAAVANQHGRPPLLPLATMLGESSSNGRSLRSPDAWREFAAWYAERRKAEGWDGLETVPYEGLKGVVAAMERQLAEVS